MKIVIREQGAQCLLVVSKKAAESKLRANLDLKTGLFSQISAATRQDGMVSYMFL